MKRAQLRATKPVLPVCEGGFGTIVADPPWRYGDQGSRLRTTYATLADEDVVALPVGEVAAEHGHIYLWSTCAHLPVALEAMRAWGYTYKRTLAWVKALDAPAEFRAELLSAVADLQQPGGARAVKRAQRLIQRAGGVRFGGGHWYRGAHELCLFGVRGRCPARTHSLSTVIMAPRGIHSAKPEELQDLAEKMSPGPYLELFARRPRPGWSTWGDQLEP